jgi:hypothetical protein
MIALKRSGKLRRARVPSQRLYERCQLHEHLAISCFALGAPPVARRRVGTNND